MVVIRAKGGGYVPGFAPSPKGVEVLPGVRVDPKTGGRIGGGGGGGRSQVSEAEAQRLQAQQAASRAAAQAQAAAKAQALKIAEAQRISVETAQRIARQQRQQKILETATASQKKTFIPPPTPTIKVHAPGTIYSAPTGKTFTPRGGTPQPTYKTYTVGEDYTSRPATPKEFQQLEEFKRAKSYEEVALKDAPSVTARWYGETKGKVSKVLDEPLVDQVALAKYTGEDIGNLVYGAVGTKGAVLQTGAVFGLTAGAGFAIKGVTAGATYGATRIAGARAGQITATTLRTGTTVGGYGLGGVYIAGQATQIYYAPTRAEKFQITGRTGADIGAGLYGFKAGGKLWTKVDPVTKVTEVVPLRAVEDPKFVERQYTVITKGKELKLAEYYIKGEKLPPRVKIETTAFREYFNLKPKDITYISPKTYSVKTTQPAVYGKPFSVLERGKGSKGGKVKIISGESQEINVRLDPLSKIDKFLLKKYAEDITGRPMSAKNVQKFFAKESDFSKAVIHSQRIADIKIPKLTKKIIEKEYAVPKQTGRLTTLDIGITRVKPSFKTPEWEAFTSETYFKDISKPFSRATGKAPKITGEIYRLRKPIILDAGVDVKSMKPADIKKTPFTKTFADQKVVSVQLPKPFPKPAPTKVSTKVVTPSVTETYTPQVSKYAGTGLYERTEGELTPTYRTGVNEKAFVQQGVSNLNSFKDFSKMNVVEVSITRTGTQPLTKIKETTKLDLLPKLKPMTKIKQSQKLFTKLKLKQLQKQKTPATKVKGIFPRPPPKTPPTPFGFNLKGITLPKPRPGRVQIFGRRFGKWKSIGFGRTAKLAVFKGQRWASRTLGVSFKVSAKVKPQKLYGFRTKKEKGELIYVEKRGRRLKRRGSEVKEIQLYKGLKGGKR